MNALVEATPEQPGQSLVALGTLQADTPKALVSGATEIANALAQVIRVKKLAVMIQGREYVKVDGWNLLGALLGVIAREEGVIEREDGSYLATVQLVRMKDDAIISRASAECGVDEFDNKGAPTWGSRPKFARRSMALTRAQGKAARLAFSWIMVLAGYQPTPLEDMPPNLPRDDDADSDLVNAGQYRGKKKWSELTSDYLNAIVRGDKAGPVFKAACQAEMDRRAKEAFSTPEKIETSDEIPF
jgi:hypothetical protein